MILTFRAWDKFDKVMRDVTLLDYNQNFVGYSYPVFMKSTMHMELMRSTGLVDKNGKEIFEGDILACETDDEVINVNVFWDEEHALFMFESKKYNERELLAELVEDNTYPFEIIGNIYENKELLDA